MMSATSVSSTPRQMKPRCMNATPATSRSTGQSSFIRIERAVRSTTVVPQYTDSANAAMASTPSQKATMGSLPWRKPIKRIRAAEMMPA